MKQEENSSGWVSECAETGGGDNYWGPVKFADVVIGGEKAVVGNPYVKGAKVTVVVEHQYRGPKVLVYKKKRRHKYRKMRGHRSELTRLFVSQITTPDGVVGTESKPHVMDLERVARKVEHKEKHKAQKDQMKAAEGSAEGHVEAPVKKVVAKGSSGAKKSGGAKKSPAKKSAGKAKTKSKK